MGCGIGWVAVLVGGMAHAAPRPAGDATLPPLDLPMFDYVFPTGFRVILQPDDSQPVVTVATVHDAGSADEPMGQEGLAHLVEHLWFRSMYGDLPSVREVQTQLGCWNNASTSFDVTDYVSTCPADALDAVLRLESLRMTDPLAGVSEAGFATERETVRNELRMRVENGWWAAQPHVLAMLYPADHPYSRPVIGTHESLDATSLEAARTFAREGYSSADTTLVINGDIERARIPEVLFANMDLTLFHPDLTPEHLRKWPLPAVESPDPDNPEHWYVWPADPNQPELPLGGGRGRRRAAKTPPDPPAPVRTGPEVHSAAVERPVTVIAWSLPGETGPESARYGSLASRMTLALRKAVPEAKREHAFCSVMAKRSASTLFCFIELDAEDRDAELSKVQRWLSEAWAPSANQSFSGVIDGYQRSRRIHEEVSEIEVVAGLWNSRAARTAHHAHLTGGASLFADRVKAILEYESEVERTVAHRWIRPERAVVVHLDPLPRSELLQASMGRSHEVGNEPTAVGLDPALLTPDVIRSSTVVPDPEQVRVRVLDNGLTVVAMRHGSTPWVRTSLVFRDGHDPTLRELADIADRDRMENALEYAAYWSDGAAPGGSSYGVVAPAEQLPGVLWMLDRRLDQRWVDHQVQDTWRTRQRARLSASVQNPAFWAKQEALRTLFPDSSTHRTTDLEAVDVRVPSRKALVAYLNGKYQPANAALVMVGDIDPDAALDLAEQYLGKWKSLDTRYAPPAPHAPAPAQRVLVLDEPRATQTRVQLRCALPPTTTADAAAHYVMQTTLETELWTILREQKGVTYGVSVAGSVFLNGDASLDLSSLVQTDAAVDALQTMRQTVSAVASGELSEELLRSHAYTAGLRSVLEFQTTRGMKELLEYTWMAGQSFDTLDDLPDHLADMTPATVAARLSGCSDHAVWTLIGPADRLMPQLEAADLSAEVFDWRAEALVFLKRYDSEAARTFAER